MTRPSGPLRSAAGSAALLAAAVALAVLTAAGLVVRVGSVLLVRQRASGDAAEVAAAGLRAWQPWVGAPRSVPAPAAGRSLPPAVKPGPSPAEEQARVCHAAAVAAADLDGRLVRCVLSRLAASRATTAVSGAPAVNGPTEPWELLVAVAVRVPDWFGSTEMSVAARIRLPAE